MPNHTHISYTVLRITLGLVFILTGFFILQEPASWIELVQPWVRDILPISLETAIYITAIYDIAQGIWLITGVYTGIASILAGLHLAQVLVVTGVNWITYRDIGLLGMNIALIIDHYFHAPPDEKVQS